MPIKYENDVVYLEGVIGVEEAEDLYKILIEGNINQIDAASCTHMHAAVLQLVVGFRLHFVGFPSNFILNQWLNNTMNISVLSNN